MVLTKLLRHYANFHILLALLHALLIYIIACKASLKNKISWDKHEFMTHHLGSQSNLFLHVV
jgi:hypothetical protein